MAKRQRIILENLLIQRLSERGLAEQTRSKDVAIKIWFQVLKDIDIRTALTLSTRFPNLYYALRTKDELWRMLWHRDFDVHLAGLPDELPFWITETPESRFTGLNEYLQFVPWRRYYLWCFRFVNQMIKTIMKRITAMNYNEFLDMLEHYDEDAMGGSGDLPLGLTMIFEKVEYQDIHHAQITTYRWKPTEIIEVGTKTRKELETEFFDDKFIIKVDKNIPYLIMSERIGKFFNGDWWDYKNNQKDLPEFLRFYPYLSVFYLFDFAFEEGAWAYLQNLFLFSSSGFQHDENYRPFEEFQNFRAFALWVFQTSPIYFATQDQEFRDESNINPKRLLNLSLEPRRDNVLFLGQCQTCGNNSHMDLQLCANCESVAYCNKQCQEKDWENHKLECF